MKLKNLIAKHEEGCSSDEDTNINEKKKKKLENMHFILKKNSN